jgi:hypothetical protein
VPRSTAHLQMRSGVARTRVSEVRKDPEERCTVSATHQGPGDLSCARPEAAVGFEDERKKDEGENPPTRTTIGGGPRRSERVKRAHLT